jgi:hypothetical protein
MSTVQQFGGNTTAVTADGNVYTWTDANRNDQVDRGDVVTRTDQSEGTVLSYVVGGGEAMQVSAGGRETRMWDVFFDARSGTKTQQWSPIVLDLNQNGQADITGANILGDGRMDGGVKGFDLTPTDRQWQIKSHFRRPGSGNADALPPGATAVVFDASGQEVRRLDADAVSRLDQRGRTMGLDLTPGMRAEFRDAQGRLVSELKWDPKNDQFATAKDAWLYYFRNVNENEWTKAWDATAGGDGLLVWDVDGDGRITSGKELFGHVDLDGSNRFANGYDKLRTHFDRDGDGVVRGTELQGLQIWEDRNGDAITNNGELVALTDRDIRRLETSFNAVDMSATAGGGGMQIDNVTWAGAAAEDAVVDAFNDLFQDARDGRLDEPTRTAAVDAALRTGGTVESIGNVDADVALRLGDGRTRLEFDVDAATGMPTFDLSVVDRDGQQRSLTVGQGDGGAVVVNDTTGNQTAQAVIADRRLVVLNEYRGANLTSGVQVFGQANGNPGDRTLVDEDGRLNFGAGRVERDAIRYAEAIARGVSTTVWKHAFGDDDEATDNPERTVTVTPAVAEARDRQSDRTNGTERGVRPTFGVIDPVVAFAVSLADEQRKGVGVGA